MLKSQIYLLKHKKKWDSFCWRFHHFQMTGKVDAGFLPRPNLCTPKANLMTTEAFVQ